jgi:hypothetical protein
MIKENIMENKVKVLKLVSGEEIITTIIEEWPQLRLDSPMMIQALDEGPFGGGLKSRNESGVSMVMLPWSFTGNTENVIINSDHVLAILEALPETVEEYKIYKEGQSEQSTTVRN